MIVRLSVRTSLLIAAVILLTAAAPPRSIHYPESRRVDHVDTDHGTAVPDPYRWLETDVRESTEVAAWVEAQNEITFGYLRDIPERARIEERLTELWNYERYGTPFKAGPRYCFSRNDGLQNQSVVYIAESLAAEPRVLFDPNAWSADGTVALGGMSFSDDGRYAAYSVAEAGSDWQTWRVRDVESGEDLADEIRWVKFSGAAWTLDGRGFFYSRYEEPSGAGHQTVNKFQKLYYHRLGTPQSDDALVYHRPDQPEWGFGSTVSEDGRYLVITIWKGTGDQVRVMYKDLTEPYGMPVDLIDHFENLYSFIGNDGPVFYFTTDLDAPGGGSSPSTSIAGSRRACGRSFPSPTTRCVRSTWSATCSR